MKPNLDMEQDILGMYNYYGQLNPRPRGTGFKLGLSNNEKGQRIAMMQEELDEYHEATDAVSEYDALIDLLVFTVGTLVQSNYPVKMGWDAVMRANMSKVVGQTKRGFGKDITKPQGWVGPEADLEKILTTIDTLHSTPLTGAMSMTNSNCDDCHPRFGCDDCPSKPDGVVKDDSGKTRYELLPWDSLKQVADVFGYGAEKYFDNSWRTQEAATYNRTFGSVMRHLTEWQMGADLDPESGLNHLAHAVSQLLILMYVEQHYPDKDDRHYSKESR